MSKKVLMFVTIVLAMVAVKGGVVSAKPVDQEDNKVTICHRTNSVVNPYVRETVDADSADGNTQNDKGQGDHSEHTGPIATTPQVAQALKNNKQDWGDIIPAHDNYAGLNWTAEGQAMYSNNCEYVEPNFETALVGYDVACPQTADGKVVVTLTNDGDVAGSALVNGKGYAVPAHGTVTVEFDQGVKIVIVIKDQTVYNQTPVCEQPGRGGEMSSSVTPTSTPQVDAPKAGVNAGAGPLALAALLMTSAASIGLGALRLRKVNR